MALRAVIIVRKFLICVHTVGPVLPGGEARLVPRGEKGSKRQVNMILPISVLCINTIDSLQLPLG
jgi:hypothetical protein